MVLSSDGVSDRGTVEPGSRIIRWTSHPAFGLAAAKAIARARWKAGTVDGVAVRVGAFQLVTFRIGKPAKPLLWAVVWVSHARQGLEQLVWIA